MYDICIIGAGSAGISSAVYAASRGKKVAIFEGDAIGGRIREVSNVTHYAGIMEIEEGNSFVERMETQLRSYPIDLIEEKVVKTELTGDVKKVYTDNECYEAKAVIIAGGTSARELDLPGLKEFEGKGTGLNAARDAQTYEGKDVFVIGGADGAVKEAIYLSKFAKKVTIIHFEDTLGTISEFLDALVKKNNIKVRLHARLFAVEGETCADRIILEDVHTGKKQYIEAPGCGVFIYAGSLPNTQLYTKKEKEDGYLVVDKHQATNIPGVFAAGDICAKQVRQVATAVNDGCIAGINAADYIDGK